MHGGVQLLGQVHDHLIKELGDSSRKPQPATASMFKWALTFDPGPQGYGSPVAGGSDGLLQTKFIFAVFSRFLDSHLNRARVDHQNGRSISSTERGGEIRGVGKLAYRFTLGSGLDCRESKATSSHRTRADPPRPFNTPCQTNAQDGMTG